MATTASTRTSSTNSVKPRGGTEAAPNAAVSHFNKELAKAPTPRKRARK
jgi:hypothetical protein